MQAYKYRIYPTEEQKIFFAKTFGCVRKVYNLMLSERITNYEAEKATGVKSKYPTPAKYKKQFEFLKEVDSLALANAQLNLQSSYTHFFRRVRENKANLGFPKYKCKHHKQSYTTNNQNGTIRIIEDRFLKLPKLKTYVKIIKHRDFSGLIKSATISKTPTGKYFVSLLIKEELKKPLNNSNDVLGIDLGITHFAILSNGSKVDNPKFLQNSLVVLAKEQKN